MSVLEFVANGLVFSSIIVLASIGLSLVYSIANFANFAHGDTMMVGAYGALVTFGAVGTLGGSVLGLPYGFFVALLVGSLVAAAVAVVTHRLVYEPVDLDSIGLLITSIGVAFVYRSVVRMGFGADFREYGIQVLQPIEALRPFGIRTTLHDVAILASAVVLVGALHALLQYTDLGRKMRATADNPDLARVSGIRTNRIEIWTWVIGAGLAGAGGVFLGLFNRLGPRMGFDILLVVFAAVILGGIGSVYGAMLGGLLIGMINEMMPLFENFGQYAPLVPADWGLPFGSEYSNAVAFLIMVAFLLAKPNGLLGESAS